MAIALRALSLRILALLVGSLAVAAVDVDQKGSASELWKQVMKNEAFRQNVDLATPTFCKGIANLRSCASFVEEALMCLEFGKNFEKAKALAGALEYQEHCKVIDQNVPKLSLLTKILAAPRRHRQQAAFLQQTSRVHTWARSGGGKDVPPKKEHGDAPEDELAKEMTHDLEMNFNKIAPFGKEDTAKELQDHAAKTQDTLVDAVENAEVAEIKRAVFRALTRLRAATIKEFDTIARLETQAIDAYNDAHHYRAENPLAHLHEDEAPVETDKLKSFH
mmetsp:Transcript_26631/g.58496  ORF Transcript_26631/g.58496 Transcript_26631/m.58496 type:complete len:277 (+) Transcript_26631:79-909(+)